MTESRQAIFLSYASQDADAARRICEVLREAGVEVWFDQSELRGGDAWDASIRKQIKECSLFVPIISATTNARSEGYFRLEWKLAVDRSHLMAESKPFLVPIMIDDTTKLSANVPDAFRVRQWSRVTNENAVKAFATRIARLVDGGDGSNIDTSKSPAAAESRHTSQTGAAKSARTGTQLAIAFAGIALIGAGIYAATVITQNKSQTTASSGATNDASKSAAINPLSVMVMPFANQTGDKEKAYIADALTSSITSDLTRIRDAFIVPTATAFSLQGKALTVPQLGKEAAVRFVLTGSVTGDKEHLRINAVLSDTQSGAQLWTENFDGKQADVFALQDQVTTRVGNSIGPQMIIVAARESEKRVGTPQVADLLMRASALDLNQQSLKNQQAMVALYRQALALEPGNLSAKAGLARRLVLQAYLYGDELKLDRAGSIALSKQGADLAEEVRRVDPNNASAYSSLASYALISGDLEGAVRTATRRLELDPKNYFAYNSLGLMLAGIGDMPGARTVLEKGLQFASPVRRPTETYGVLSSVAFRENQPDEAIKWAQQAIDANPVSSYSHLALALAYASKGDQVRARKAAAEAVRLNPTLKLDLKDDIPWPGKEAAYRKFIDTQLVPAWRLAGLPE